MKVKLKTCMAGPAGTFLPGDIIEDNGDLVKGGYAELIENIEMLIEKTVNISEVETTENKPIIEIKKNNKKPLKAVK